jgi:hypothetical protein
MRYDSPLAPPGLAVSGVGREEATKNRPPAPGVSTPLRRNKSRPSLKILIRFLCVELVAVRREKFNNKP